jgi:hypothetical protein
MQVTLVIHGGCVPANRRVYRKRVALETYNNRHFDVKLAPEFFDASFIICITFPDKPGEGSTQVIVFKIWRRILMFLMILKYNRGYAKTLITRVTCIRNIGSVPVDMTAMLGTSCALISNRHQMLTS